MDIIPQKIINYAEKHSESEPKILQELRKETWQKIVTPRMLSGHLQGRLLAMISKMIKPKMILEIGTYTGYATLCLAEGLAKNGIIHTIDYNEELVDFQKKYFNMSEFSSQIIQHTGNALHIVPQLNETFDLVFIDADKINYSNYYDLIINKLRKGGIILSDNVLWSGKVIKKPDRKDLNTLSIIHYNLKIKNDKRVETILLPFRDGISITRKL
jgi:predicted O-methyltransferase YrrM